MAVNVNDWYTQALYLLRNGEIEQTRNGPVRTMQSPELFTVQNPRERVLFNPKRNANPYLHVMETVWMFAGCNEVDFLLPFSKQMGEYANEGIINGAYGHRWRKHFNRDQIMGVILELKERPDSRQAVIAMYDPSQDHPPHWKDRPCNTHIYFRVVNGKLEMTVCNRSNDVVWGMCGANAVHMTYLQELVAAGIRRPVGRYHVLTNNLHIYEHHWGYLDSPATYDHYELETIAPYPLLGENETDVWEFLEECRVFLIHQAEGHYSSSWINNVVIPMYEHYMCRLNGDYYTYDTTETRATDWQLAEYKWRERHAE